MSSLTVLDYPVTGHALSAAVDLTARQERERLSASALKAFFNLVNHWHIRDEDARVLLGGLSNGPYYAWKKQPDRLLDADVLTRISFLIGIFKALHILYGEKLADQWIGLANTNRIFGGKAPLHYMMRGGLPAMQTVRRLLDARRGGM